ncbi:hypothetical protein NEISICOT_03649 [Neisseria sicca ATCC 29256]|uniref:Uncharacterized protein n=1 Tax=Neisseria sicca ATCC 29256 TaxID=547045 RepID=C6MAR7_NEISI|nr:hypothetical protein NEISICOT_03649 [Neisseria sicca ATCC 29256]
MLSVINKPFRHFQTTQARGRLKRLKDRCEGQVFRHNGYVSMSPMPQS